MVDWGMKNNTPISNLIESLNISDEAEKASWAELATLLLKSKPEWYAPAFTQLYHIANSQLPPQLEWDSKTALNQNLAALLDTISSPKESGLAKDDFYRLQTFLSKKLVISKERFRDEAIKFSKGAEGNPDNQGVAQQKRITKKYIEQVAAPELFALQSIYSKYIYGLANSTKDTVYSTHNDKHSEAVGYMLHTLVNASIPKNKEFSVGGMLNKAHQLRSRPQINKTNGVTVTPLETGEYSLSNMLPQTESFDQENSHSVNTIIYGLSQLTPARAKAFIMRDINELSYKEISSNLAVPEGTIKSAIHFGRKGIIKAIQELPTDEHGDAILPKEAQIYQLFDDTSNWAADYIDTLNKGKETASAAKRKTRKPAVEKNSERSWQNKLDKAASENEIGGDISLK